MDQAKNNGKLLLDTKLLNLTKPMGTKRDRKFQKYPSQGGYMS